jgi:uncharacterized protein (DUF2237 family)
MFDREDGSGPGGRTGRNVLGGVLAPCSMAPLTGYFRDGCCHTDASDLGRHVVCAEVSAEFLEFSVARGNDLVTPRPEFGFAGLKPGDRWCLCAARWLEAHEAGSAPPVVLAATHVSALQLMPLDLLQRYAADA